MTPLMTQATTPASPAPAATRQGPYGLESLSGNPICDECDLEMNPYSGRSGRTNVAGYACAGCGWSFDTSSSVVSAGL
ncbi:hypothetical protein H6P1_00472 (plasmid) [Variovorax sp. PBL-H6]|nr:hypothetical protein SRS16P1_00434 [Variovorax sp. SRS16]VTU43118.1 hypothetical protein E5P1_00431 [Variovorax sp. PBL-E5]VTU43458.1 hypothetical protein H6P1_00472 [Variovorax sp. PBL-H6]